MKGCTDQILILSIGLILIQIAGSGIGDNRADLVNSMLFYVYVYVYVRILRHASAVRR